MKKILKIVLLSIFIFVLSCADYEDNIEYKIDDFDNGVGKYLENTNSSLSESYNLLSIESLDETFTDNYIDETTNWQNLEFIYKATYDTTFLTDTTWSSIDTTEFTTTIIDTTNSYEVIPSNQKLNLAVSSNYTSGYGILDLSSFQSLQEWTIYLNDYAYIDIWTLSGEKIEATNSKMAVEVIADYRDVLKYRYTYDLNNQKYLFRVKKSESVKSVGTVTMLFIQSDYSISTNLQSVSTAFENKTVASSTNLISLTEIDSANFVNMMVNDIDSMFLKDNMSKFIDTLNSIGLAIYKMEINMPMDESNTGLCILDLTSNTSSSELNFFLNKSLKINVFSVNDSIKVIADSMGITFEESLAGVEQRAIFSLKNQKYLVAFTKYSSGDVINDFYLYLKDF